MTEKFDLGRNGEQIPVTNQGLGVGSWCSMMYHYTVVDHDGKFKACTECIGENASQKEVQFNSYKELRESTWLASAKEEMANGIWPKSCSQCQGKEANNIKSMRQNHNEEHLVHKLIREDYLKVELITDNLCNGACQMCHSLASTRIGALYDKRNYPLVDNRSKFDTLPIDRITRLDIIGGEPSYSSIAKGILKNVPTGVVAMKIATNGSKSLVPYIEPLLQRGIKIRITLSFDGVGPVYDYVRWPVKYEKVVLRILEYIEFGKKYPDNFALRLTLTVSTLNVNDMINIYSFADKHNLLSSFCLVSWPPELDPRFSNTVTRRAKEALKESSNPFVLAISNLIAVKEDNQEKFEQFVQEQDKLRNIKVEDYVPTLLT